MSLLERIAGKVNQSIREQQEQQAYEDMMMNQPLGGQPLGPAPTTVIPPSFEHETMELYLKPQFPKEMINGAERYWPFTTSFATTVQTANMNAHRQRKILLKMQIAQDFEGVDNVEALVQREMIETVAEIITDKARSDFSDGIRDRLASGTGIGISGQLVSGKDTGERPKESGAIRGIFGRKDR